MDDVLKGTHILSGSQSPRLRAFCSDAVWAQSDLDEYARLLQRGPLETIDADFKNRVSTSSLEVALARLASISYGPSKIPLYNYLIQLLHLNPASRMLYLSTIEFLAGEAKVPVDTPDISGTTALVWSISTKPIPRARSRNILFKPAETSTVGTATAASLHMIPSWRATRAAMTRRRHVMLSSILWSMEAIWTSSVETGRPQGL